MHWTVLLSNFTLKLRDVSASPTEPSGLHDPHTDICYTGRLNSFFFPSHIFHFCLFPGSTYRAAKIEFLVKFKQGGGLLDNDPRRGISISVHAICRLLEICWLLLDFLYISVLPNQIRWQNVLLWCCFMGLKTTKFSPTKEGAHPLKNISFTLITACVICLHTLKWFIRWCL